MFSALFFYLFVSLSVSFLCSLFEAVILSLTPAYLASLTKSRSRSGKLLQELKSNIEESLAAILTCNTIAHTLGAAGAGAEILKLYGDKYVALGSAIITLLILVISEIIPKTIGATYWKQLAPYVGYGIKTFIFITYPFVIILQYLSRKIGAGENHHNSISRDEIAFAAQLGKKSGSILPEEEKTIRNLLQLREILVKDIMTPRTVVFALSESMSLEDLSQNSTHLRFSRIPIFNGIVDKITGLVLRFEVLEMLSSNDKSLVLKTLSHPIHRIPPTLSVSEVLREFLERREHLFAIYDEHGGFSGVVTLEDALETLLGIEIVDEYDSVTDMRQHARELWKKRRDTYA